jgi:hypothetical protein
MVQHKDKYKNYATYTFNYVINQNLILFNFV